MSNVKRDGVVYEAGKIIQAEGAELAEFIATGVVKHLRGAQSMSDARRIANTDDTPTEPQEEANTWGPKKDPVPPVVENKPVEATTEADTTKEQAPVTQVTASPLQEQKTDTTGTVEPKVEETGAEL